MSYMPNKYNGELDKNIAACAFIRDNPTSKPIAIIQAVRAIHKLIAKDNASEHPQFQKNLDALTAIRDDATIEDTLRIMAMNSINTMLDGVVDTSETRPTPDDILKKIRSKKK